MKKSTLDMYKEKQKNKRNLLKEKLWDFKESLGEFKQQNKDRLE